eukprot:TRINITY_DN12378_c0_g1_i13.p1 TRINITY_DN12378_c0_g1~~TRINITY_DN12378_c0_g1_i13.p1  ORF type:complete len:833 (+),score=184.71 TRINITY_DN12378_c0_g1_i13:2084-4582(+)
MNRENVLEWLLANPSDFDAIVIDHASDGSIKAWRDRRGPSNNLLAPPSSPTPISGRVSTMIYSREATQLEIRPLARDEDNLHLASSHLLGLLELEEVAAQIVADLSVHFSSGHCLLFIMDHEQQTLELATPKSWYKGARSFPIDHGLAGTAAATQKVIDLGSEAKEHPEFNRDIDAEPETATESVLVIPLMHKDEIYAVAEVVNRNKHKKFKEGPCKEYLAAAAVSVHNAAILERALKECRALNALLSLARSTFQDLDSLEKTVKRIIANAATLVDCDQCSLFMLDAERNELVATVFDAMDDDAPAKHIRFPKDKGVAGHVATTGQTLLIPDAYADSRFNSAVDKQTGYRTRNILCMPIHNKNAEIVGVAQLVNKTAGCFNQDDQRLSEAFAVFCGLGIQAVQLYEETQKAAYRNKVALEVLSYHARASEDDTKELMAKEIPSDEKWQLNTFHHDSVSLELGDTVLAVLRMFKNMGFVEEFRMPYQSLCQWVLSVRKNYRPVTYHNWRHAFSVTQCMYSMLLAPILKEHFSMLERLALLVACLCHDLDHRGTNNAFQKHANNALSQLYSTSTMENHHFDQCIMILNQEGNNFLSSISVDDYEHFIELLRRAILSTDLSIYLSNRNEYFELVKTNTFDFNNKDHIVILQSILMTAADISAITRPWHVQRQVAEVVYAEFFEQGDAQRQLGTDVEPLLDRNKVEDLPKMQLGFIDFICLPVYKHLAMHDSFFQPMVDNVNQNRDQWEKLCGQYEGFSSLPQSFKDKFSLRKPSVPVPHVNNTSKAVEPKLKSIPSTNKSEGKQPDSSAQDRAAFQSSCSEQKRSAPSSRMCTLM